MHERNTCPCQEHSQKGAKTCLTATLLTRDRRQETGATDHAMTSLTGQTTPTSQWNVFPCINVKKHTYFSRGRKTHDNSVVFLLLCFILCLIDLCLSFSYACRVARFIHRSTRYVDEECEHLHKHSDTTTHNNKSHPLARLALHPREKHAPANWMSMQLRR